MKMYLAADTNPYTLRLVDAHYHWGVEINMTPEEMAADLDSAIQPGSAQASEDSYVAGIRWAGRIVLDYLRAHPTQWVEVDNGENGAAGVDALCQIFDAAVPNPARVGLDGITGFMVGAAINSARFALRYNELPNPATVTIDSSQMESALEALVAGYPDEEDEDDDEDAEQPDASD